MKIPDSYDIPTVEWSKEGLKPDVVYLYREGCETFEMKNLDFEYRTTLFMREVKNGNVSLRISGVQPSDAGTYQCLKIWKKGPRESTKVKLVVVASSDPKLAVVAVDSRGVTVECEARCWLPKPLMRILDDKENNLTVEEPKLERTDRGCYNMKLTVILQSPVNRIICSINQQKTKESKTAEILLGAHWRPSFNPATIIVCTIVVTIFVVCIFSSGLYLCCRTQSTSAGQKQTLTKKLSDQSLTTNTSECILEQSAVQDETEIPEDKTNGLRSDDRRKDETTGQPDETAHNLQNVRAQHRSALSQLEQPTIPRSPYKSSPELHYRASGLNTDRKNLLCDRNLKSAVSKSVETVCFSSQNRSRCDSQKPTTVQAATYTSRSKEHNKSCVSLTGPASPLSKSPTSSKKRSKTDIHSKSDPSTQKVGLVHQKHPPERASSFHSYNPYSPLASLANNV
ncbi:butyrophilin subfamily 2 member A2 isoform X2 [Fundulus heteroclitus]|nr:butyrophilin subfamily 2 member A2 isoform X2 [Fundulus heteroclitus]XP_035985644.1 butyrophilin subfamily 2 member A2 isoform X2 [Fundulus heteroclitus]